MKYTQLGNSKFKVSKIGLGTRLLDGSTLENKNGFDSLIESAFDNGINFFIGAGHYSDGKSEMALGNAISSFREQAIIATSAGVVRTETGIKIDLSIESLQKQLNSSLKNLQTDYIDLFQIHYSTPFCNISEIYEFLEEQIESGIIRSLGVSNFRLDELENWKQYGVNSIQMPYNPIQQEIEERYFEICRNNNISILAYTPLSAGLFTNKRLTPGFIWEYEDSISSIDQNNLTVLMLKLNQAAEEMDRPISDVVLSWIANNPNITSVLIGTSNIQHLLANVSAIENKLSTSENLVFNELLTEINSVFPDGVVLPLKVDEIKVYNDQKYTSLFGSIYLPIPSNVNQEDTIIVNDTTGKIVKIL